MVAGPVVNVEKPSALARLFQAAVGIRIKKKAPQATDCFADFHSCGIFHRPFSFLFWFFFLLLMGFPCGKPARSRYESATLLGQRLEETFERDRYGKLDVCSDVVLRGLDYKDYGDFLPVWFETRETMENVVDVETEYGNRRICRVGLGRPETRCHFARSRQ